MNKDIFTYIIVFGVLFLTGFYTHQFLLENLSANLSFSLEKIYLFHALFSGIVCINLRVVSTVDKLFPQLGFIYLGILLIKLVLFSIFFYNPIFTRETFNLTRKRSPNYTTIYFFINRNNFCFKNTQVKRIVNN